jgi:hypothetical protein
MGMIPCDDGNVMLESWRDKREKEREREREGVDTSIDSLIVRSHIQASSFKASKTRRRRFAFVSKP